MVSKSEFLVGKQMLAVVMNENVAGYEIEKLTDEDGKQCSFLSCYSSRFYEWFGKKEKKIAMLSEDGQVDYVYYYPTEDGDKLLWSQDGNSPSYGVVTLPRLVYNYWVLLAAGCSVLGMLVYFLLKNRYLAKIVMKITLYPISLLVSMLLILSGHFGEVYNATYYFSGILLLSAAIYVFLIKILNQRKKQKAGN